jgi:hypothetical protein
VLERFCLAGQVDGRLITNGSLMHRPEVQRGIKLLGELGGEVWFKIDRVESADAAEVNGVPIQVEKIARHLEICAGLASTWVQTCWFALDGQAPGCLSPRGLLCFVAAAGRSIGGHPSLRSGSSLNAAGRATAQSLVVRRTGGIC